MEGEKQLEGLQSLKITNNTTELKQLEDIIPQSQLNNSIIGRLKELRKYRPLSTITHKIFETNSDFHVKYRTTGKKFSFCFSRVFC